MIKDYLCPMREYRTKYIQIHKLQRSKLFHRCSINTSCLGETGTLRCPKGEIERCVHLLIQIADAQSILISQSSHLTPTSYSSFRWQ